MRGGIYGLAFTVNQIHLLGGIYGYYFSYLLSICHQDWVEGSRYGRNKKSVLDALDEHNEKSKVIEEYQREVNKIKRQVMVIKRVM